MTTPPPAGLPGRGVWCASGAPRTHCDLADPQARHRQTIPAEQLTLALGGEVDHVWAYSFIATNLDVSTPQKAPAGDAWYRDRTDIEDRIRDAKHGAALRHLPSGHTAVNTTWMWGALLAVNLSAWLHELAGMANGQGRRRVHLGRLRRELICIPAPPPRSPHHPAPTTGRVTPRGSARTTSPTARGDLSPETPPRYWPAERS